MTKILVVEDEEHILRVVALTLVSEGYEIIEAVHGLMGYTKAVSEHPNLIIMDLNMPVMDGLEALNKLKGNPETAEIPVIILTARIDSASERECMRAGAVDYIKKPWGQQELEDRVAMALDYPEDVGRGREYRVNTFRLEE